MSIDTSKIQYYTGYNAYKNLGVYPGSIAIDTTSVAPGTVRTWSSTVSVEPNSKFAWASIEANEPDGLNVTPFRWQSFPSVTAAYQTLSVDPLGNGWFDLLLDIEINNNQVTFRANAFNPNAIAYAFNVVSINFIYAAHTMLI